MLPVKAGWVRWAPVNAVVNGVITYGKIEQPGGLVSFEDEIDEDITKLAADNNASYHSLQYYKGTNVTMSLGDDDLDKLSTATRYRKLENGAYVLDPDKTPSRVGVAHLSAMVNNGAIVKYRVTWYPMISFKTPNSSVKTGGDDIEIDPIELEGEALTATGIYPKYQEYFDTEARAIAWAEGQLGRQIDVQIDLGNGHVQDQAENHEMVRQNVRAGLPVAIRDLVDGLAQIVPPEGQHLLGFALEPAGQVVELIYPALGQGMQEVAQRIYAIYEQNQEQGGNNENQNQNENPEDNINNDDNENPG